MANFIPDLSPNDRAALNILTHFVTWAGRYPDPGSGREDNSESIFILSEKHQISAKDLYLLATRIIGHAQGVIDGVTDYKFI